MAVSDYTIPFVDNNYKGGISFSINLIYEQIKLFFIIKRITIHFPKVIADTLFDRLCQVLLMKIPDRRDIQMYNIILVHMFLVICIGSKLRILKKLCRIAAKAIVGINHSRGMRLAETSSVA